jgi:hypothetical protein
MSSLRQKLNDLAATFADSVLGAIRTASIDELTAEAAGGRRPAARSVVSNGASASVGVAPVRARRRGGRLPRRSAGDIAGVIDQITGLLRTSPKGLRAEQIRQKLGLEAKELPRPLKEAVDAGRLGKSGQKRATTYFLKGGSGTPAPAARKSSAGARTAGRSSKRGKRPTKAKK